MTSTKSKKSEQKRSCVRVMKEFYTYLVSLSIEKKDSETRHVYECVMSFITGMMSEGTLFTPYVCSTYTSYPHRDCTIVCQQFEKLGFLDKKFSDGEPIYSLRSSVLVHTPLSTLTRALTIKDKKILESFILSNSFLRISRDNTKY